MRQDRIAKWFNSATKESFCCRTVVVWCDANPFKAIEYVMHVHVHVHSQACSELSMNECRSCFSTFHQSRDICSLPSIMTSISPQWHKRINYRRVGLDCNSGSVPLSPQTPSLALLLLLLCYHICCRHWALNDYWCWWAIADWCLTELSCSAGMQSLEDVFLSVDIWL